MIMEPVRSDGPDKMDRVHRRGKWNKAKEDEN